MALFLLILTTMVWGSTFVIIKDAVTTVDPFFLVFARNAMAAIAMMLFLAMRDRAVLRDRAAWGRGAVLGFLLFATYASQTLGLRLTSAGHSAFITGAAVVVVPVILFVLYRERLARREWACVLVVFAGLALLTIKPGMPVNLGDVITLATTVSYAVHVILAGRFLRVTNSLALINAQFFFAALFSMVAFVLSGSNPGILTTTAWGALVYLGLIGTLFCYFVTVWTQKTVSSVQVMVIFALEPVFAALFGYWMLKEALSFRELSGAILMLVGVVVYQVLIGIRKKKVIH